MIKRDVLIFAFALILVLPLASAGFFDFITGKLIENTQNVNVGVGNSAPIITSVSVISAFTPTEAGLLAKTFTFTVYDHDLAADIDSSSGHAQFVKGSETYSNNSCIVTATRTAEKDFECTIVVPYYITPGSWTIVANASDMEPIEATNDTTTFTVNDLDAFTLAPASVTYGTLGLGASNTLASNNPSVLNNTGNRNQGVSVNATTLTGVTYSTYKIGADLFDINTANSCGGTALVNSTFVTISGASVPKFVPASVDGTEQLYHCLTSVPSGLVKQTYNTAAEGAWTVKITAA